MKYIGETSRERSRARESGSAASSCLSQELRGEASQHQESRRADGDGGQPRNVSRPAICSTDPQTRNSQEYVYNSREYTLGLSAGYLPENGLKNQVWCLGTLEYTPC